MIQIAAAAVAVKPNEIFPIIAGKTLVASVAVNAPTTSALNFESDLPLQSNAIADIRL